MAKTREKLGESRQETDIYVDFAGEAGGKRAGSRAALLMTAAASAVILIAYSLLG